MESLRQSGAKISEQSWRKRENHENDGGGPTGDRRERGEEGAGRVVRVKAMKKEIEPLMSSLSNTAVAGEYAFDAGVDTRE